MDLYIHPNENVFASQIYYPNQVISIFNKGSKTDLTLLYSQFAYFLNSDILQSAYCLDRISFLIPDYFSMPADICNLAIRANNSIFVLCIANEIRLQNCLPYKW